MTKISKCEYCGMHLMHEDYEEPMVYVHRPRTIVFMERFGGKVRLQTKDVPDDYKHDGSFEIVAQVDPYDIAIGKCFVCRGCTDLGPERLEWVKEQKRAKYLKENKL